MPIKRKRAKKQKWDRKEIPIDALKTALTHMKHNTLIPIDVLDELEEFIETF